NCAPPHLHSFPTRRSSDLIHPFVKQEGKWVQNTDHDQVLEEIKKFFPVAKEHGITHTVRLGWGYQTNQVMSLLSDLGCRADSSRSEEHTTDLQSRFELECR